MHIESLPGLRGHKGVPSSFGFTLLIRNHLRVLFPVRYIILIPCRRRWDTAYIQGIGYTSEYSALHCPFLAPIMVFNGPLLSPLGVLFEKAPDHVRLKEAFDMAVRKGKGSRIVVIDRDGSVLMDSKK